MKVLYAIQGTGNGHIGRAMEIVPILQKKCELDVLISGKQVELKVNFPIKYNLKGLGFFFGKSGGIDYLRTATKNNSLHFAKEIKNLPIKDYDLVINDFEPISAWAARNAGITCVALSNQCVTLHPDVPKPKHRDPLGELVLNNYAPSDVQYGYHFQKFAENIFTPIIRKQIRGLETSNAGHYTVYLPAYDDQRLIRNLSRFPDVHWEVFSKHNKTPFEIGNISIVPVSGDAFLKSLASCSGILSAAGFGATAEALFLKKKLLVIPQKNQYEQYCNAAVLKFMGVPVMKSLKKKNLYVIEDWLENGKIVPVDYPDITEEILDMILEKHG